MEHNDSHNGVNHLITHPLLISQNGFVGQHSLTFLECESNLRNKQQICLEISSQFRFVCLICGILAFYTIQNEKADVLVLLFTSSEERVQKMLFFTSLSV